MADESIEVRISASAEDLKRVMDESAEKTRDAAEKINAYMGKMRVETQRVETAFKDHFSKAGNAVKDASNSVGQGVDQIQKKTGLLSGFLEKMGGWTCPKTECFGHVCR